MSAVILPFPLPVKRPAPHLFVARNWQPDFIVTARPCQDCDGWRVLIDDCAFGYEARDFHGHETALEALGFAYGVAAEMTQRGYAVAFSESVLENFGKGGAA